MTAPVRWVIGDIVVWVPETWIVHGEPDTNGTHRITPPAGSGRLAFWVTSDDNAPPVLSETYARDHAARGIRTIFPAAGDRLRLHHRGAAGYAAAVQGEAQDGYVVATVHVLPGGLIVVGWYWTADRTDSYLDEARDILSTFEPR